MACLPLPFLFVLVPFLDATAATAPCKPPEYSRKNSDTGDGRVTERELKSNPVLAEQLLDDVSMFIRQPEVPPLMAEGELGMVQAETV